jgi:hypothetical protein
MEVSTFINASSSETIDIKVLRNGNETYFTSKAKVY